MNFGALWLVLLNFIAIGALPLVFFRRDEGFNFMWWVTAWPFFATPVLLIAGYLEFIDAWTDLPWLVENGQAMFVGLLSASSILLIGLTVGTHRTPLSLWHQKEDAPESIVQDGPYRWIRHPFYTSFLLAFLAALLLMPGYWTGGILIYGFLVLNYTAAKEEKNLANSQFGDEYSEYVKRTGRFWPRIGSRS